MFLYKKYSFYQLLALAFEPVTFILYEFTPNIYFENV